MYKFLLFTLSFLASTILFGQITIDATQTPQDLVQNALVGNGVTVSNVSFSGNSQQIGYFDGSASNIGLPNGIVMSSGTVLDIVPPNQPTTGQYSAPGDNDLLSIAQSVSSNPDAPFISSTNDASILEFDFMANGDSVKFSFVFASEEYETYINSVYNDAFGFFLSGPGITGPYASPVGFPGGAINLALVPGTSEPITISTIHPGLNSSYYLNNPSGFSFNGFTVPIEIAFEVQCGQTYHFKFAVADCEDDYLDTGVFLEGNSFQSNSIVVESTASVTGAFTDTLLAEGCVYSTLDFIRPLGSDTIVDTIPLFLSGTIDVLADLVGGFPDTLFFPIGVDTVSVQLNPIDDGLSEGMEWIQIKYYSLTPCGDTLYDSLTFYLLDNYPLNYDLIDSLASPCLLSQDQVEISNFANSLPPYSVSWDFGSTDNPVDFPLLSAIDDTITRYVTITDGCGDAFLDSVVHYIDPQSLTWTLADTIIGDCITHLDQVQVANFGTTPPPYSVSWNFGSTDNPADLPLLGGINDTTTYYVDIMDGCGFTYQDSVVHLINPLSFNYTLPDTVVNVCVASTNEISITGFVGSYAPYSANWSFGDNGLSVTLPQHTANYDTLDFYVDIQDGCGTIIQDTVVYISNQVLIVDSVASVPTSCLPPSGIVYAFVNPSNVSGQAQYEWSGPGSPSANVYHATTWDSLSSGWYYFTVTDAVCSASDSVFVDINMPPQAIISASTSAGCSPLSVVFTNNSQNASSYAWDLGDGNYYPVATTAPQYGTYTDNAIISLVASNGTEQCNDTTYAFVAISACGCMDLAALNYDPMATIDDGACEYAEPIVVAPNVFTPNADDINSVYQLQVSFADEVELIIVDRWGNTVFDGKGKNPTWDGTAMNGNAVPDGVYFYRYKATTAQGKTTEGDGFIQVFH